MRKYIFIEIKANMIKTKVSYQFNQVNIKKVHHFGLGAPYDGYFAICLPLPPAPVPAQPPSSI